MIELFIIYWNFYKVASPTTTIFKLIGPCEILSHGQKSQISNLICYVLFRWTEHLVSTKPRPATAWNAPSPPWFPPCLQPIPTIEWPTPHLPAIYKTFDWPHAPIWWVQFFPPATPVLPLVLWARCHPRRRHPHPLFTRPRGEWHRWRCHLWIMIPVDFLSPKLRPAQAIICASGGLPSKWKWILC